MASRIIIFIIAVLVGIVGAKARSAGRSEGKDSSSEPGRVNSGVKSRPVPAAYRPQRTAAARVQPQPTAEAGKAARPEAPSTTGARRVIPAPALKPGRDGAKGIPDSLSRIFCEEEQLLAAFIFHEVLGPPRSLRR